MKIKKNELQELKKGGLKILNAKLQEVKNELITAKVKKAQASEIKDVRNTRTLRRIIAQLNTFIGSIKETK
ncbi:MAG: hypothetical protein WCL07_02080 [bacterium]